MAAPELNPAQHQAVNTLVGPLLVLAGAGSGKTRVITFRIAKLIRSGIAPDRILAVTFTNKAAKEMRERALALLGKRKGRKEKTPEISTFHSLCVRILRRNINQLGYPNEFPIYDRSDQEGLARAALRDVRVGHDKLRPGDLLYQISTWKSSSVRPPRALEIAQGDKELLAALAYEKYQNNLRASGAVDFDDLLLLTEELLEKFPEVRFKESGRFDHLLIDEYQDTNGLQYQIVKYLAARHRNLCVVGDDDQSIYGWRGAEVEHILNFKNDWPDATVVRLEANYRSREAILELANTLIKHNSTRHDKVLRAYRLGGEPPRFVRFNDETVEAQSLVREIKHRLENQDAEKRVYPSDFAILFRTNEQPRAFEVELRRAQVPYKLVGGQSFYDRKEVRDLMAYLKVISYPRDEVSLLRIINTPARGISAATVKSLMSQAVDSARQLWEVLAEAAPGALFTPLVVERLKKFQRLIENYKARDEALSEARQSKQPSDASLVDIVRDLLVEVDYKAELQRLYDNPNDVESRLNALEEVVNAVGSYEARARENGFEGYSGLRGFLEEMALSTRDDLKDEDDKHKKEAVTLMTLHSAKGLEFPYVYMVGMEEGILPHQRTVLENKSVDEERRLAYVGVTRAQDGLTLSFCKGRMKWGKERASIPSRFIMEMRGDTERAQRIAEASRQALEEAMHFGPSSKAGTKGTKAGAKAASPARPINDSENGKAVELPNAPALRSAQGASKRPTPRSENPFDPNSSPSTEGRHFQLSGEALRPPPTPTSPPLDSRASSAQPSPKKPLNEIISNLEIPDRPASPGRPASEPEAAAQDSLLASILAARDAVARMRLGSSSKSVPPEPEPVSGPNPDERAEPEAAETKTQTETKTQAAPNPALAPPIPTQLAPIQPAESEPQAPPPLEMDSAPLAPESPSAKQNIPKENIDSEPARGVSLSLFDLDTLACGPASSSTPALANPALTPPVIAERSVMAERSVKSTLEKERAMLSDEERLKRALATLASAFNLK